MSAALALQPALEVGVVKTTATLQDPWVELSADNGEMPVLTIEEGGVVLQLEFAAPESFTRFRRRLSELSLPEEETP